MVLERAHGVLEVLALLEEDCVLRSALLNFCLVAPDQRIDLVNFAVFLIDLALSEVELLQVPVVGQLHS